MEDCDIDPREPFPSEEDLAELAKVKAYMAGSNEPFENYDFTYDPDDLEILNANEVYDYLNEDKEF